MITAIEIAMSYRFFAASIKGEKFSKLVTCFHFFYQIDELSWRHNVFCVRKMLLISGH